MHSSSSLGSWVSEESFLLTSDPSMFVQTVLLPVQGWAGLPHSVMNWTAESITVSLRITRSAISSRGYYGLSHEIKIPGEGMGSREFCHAMPTHDGKVQSGTPAGCLSFPNHFCWMVVSAQFDIIYLPLAT